jgi:glycosyltransferase involved in cell wall biosynthesis
MLAAVRLGILASEMQGERTGVGRFLEGLLAGLAVVDFDGEVQLFFQGEPFEHALWSDPRFRPSFASSRRRSAVVWEQLSLPRRLEDAGLDLFFGPAYSLPPRLPCPALVALHDLSFEVLPEEFGARERWRRRKLARSAAERASRVLTLSRRVAGEIERIYGVAPDRIDVLPLAVDASAFTVTPSDNLAARVAPPYLLYLGSVLPRRRVDLVLEAFAAIARDRPDLRLVIAGGNRLPRPEELEEWIERSGVRNRVVELGWTPEAELAALLAGAEVSVYLSTYEGFGLPPIESLAAGTPPVVSAGLGLDELWPDYPFRCERLDAAEVERVTRRALDDAALRREVAARGRELARGLTWEDCARRFLDSAGRALGTPASGQVSSPAR